ncbi:DM13 domain-containing protein [Pedobacter sp. PAMC26386]|nr:DM13 domain-containing protein [Pedobacter sp. PAMC26386]
MRYFIVFIALLPLLSACKKESSPTRQLDETVDLAKVEKKASGEFSNGPYGQVIGQVRVYSQEQDLILALENFSSSNGPDLKVYLSKEETPVNFYNLGSLRSTRGNQIYKIPQNVNYKDYKYVLVFCQQFKHVFGVAAITF